MDKARRPLTGHSGSESQIGDTAANWFSALKRLKPFKQLQVFASDFSSGGRFAIVRPCLQF